MQKLNVEWSKTKNRQRNATENGFGEYAIPEETGVIFDGNGCRVLNPVSDKNTSTMTAAERREMNRQIKQLYELVNGAREQL